jgi:endonuclease/exonuclease/phosphatase family metal-dependent hydrolase
MFFRTNTLKAKLRRMFNPDEWMVRLLGLSVIKGESSEPGTVVIQVDGLSHKEFRRALNRHEMPHLSKLLKKEGYVDFMHYSGQPSCTPAVQGELFYGVKSCVPAFSFREKISGRTFNMFSPVNAAEIENSIKTKGAPLLKEGSAYGNIYTGGANEAHFCVSAIGWGTLFRASNPVAMSVFILMHPYIIIRSVMLTIAEFFLALFDSVRGFMKGTDLFDEIKYIPFRVIACVIIREITGIGAKIDITRGLPVIHINLAGYDEQSHHRGPGSKFAHWSLRAIDKVMAGVWKAAKRSSRRDYDILIYSDHGQEETINYTREYGRPVQEAVHEVLKEELVHDGLRTELRSNGLYRRADHLGSRWVKALPVENEKNEAPEKTAVITALGPVGHIYSPKKLTQKQKARIAQKLVTAAKIPMVIISCGRGKAAVWNEEGRFELPRDAARVLGAGHPFLKETAHDLVKLCGHKNAGDIIISGLRKQGRSVTFYNERGSHGGPGPNETAGFALLPPEAGLPLGKTINTKEIRQAVFRSLKRRYDGPNAVKTESPTNGPVGFKIMSYNIHACKGRDGKVMPERIARVIAGHNPDIIALQEVDTADNLDQAKVIATMLSMNYYYHSSVLLKTGLHGNAIFSRFGIKLVKRGSLPSFIHSPLLEKRGALWVEINVHGRKVQVINTHLSLFPPERKLQVKALLGADWLGSPDCKGAVILCGDFNSPIHSIICRAMGKDFHSIHFHTPGFRHLKTFPSFFPLALVDHIFLGHGVRSAGIEVPKTNLEKEASDHLPLIAGIRIDAVKI